MPYRLRRGDVREDLDIPDDRIPTSTIDDAACIYFVSLSSL